ncbi:GFA family protein [Loktanella sp. S4079]|uniref:GFA family protein n=1 Tax=Loktanella sp. S4079 TaxID=579483 RepID=UPI0005F9F3B1|nr:GFA family protein [Loktanella sp. S4079]KJZ18832.1 aldehyde-activating protein [Loktanella sp. S4079]
MNVISCNCGSVSFEIKAQPSDIYVCHCSICQRFSGAGGMPVVILKNDDFNWLSGQEHIKVWRKPDADWEANFCSICGSALPGMNDPDRMFVPAGILPPDIEGLEIKHHIFVGSKACWDEIAGAGKQHDGPFTG